jgi:tetratricopeptide (TPR) repeat protein
MNDQSFILRLTKDLKAEDNDFVVEIVKPDLIFSGPEAFTLSDNEKVYSTKTMGKKTAVSKTLKQLKDDINEDAVTAGEMEMLGDFLYQKIFQPKIKDAFASIQASSPDTSYRMFISVGDAPFLETVPWEYLRKEGAFFALELSNITRLLANRSSQPFPLIENINMLLVYANPEELRGDDADEYETIERESRGFLDNFVSKKLEQEYGIRVTVLEGEQATRENLFEAWHKEHYDIVHFICHGRVLGGKGHLILAHEDGGGLHDDVAGDDIRNNLPERPPRFFYFNSCNTAKAEDHDAFSSITQTLLKPGGVKTVPAIVAMQYNINVSDSFTMAEQFYFNLLSPESATRGDLETAMTKARRKIRSARPSWGIPILFLQTRQQVFLFGADGGEPAPVQLKQYLQSSVPTLQPIAYSNRTREVNAVRDSVDSGAHVTVIHGLPGSGRATVARAAIEEPLQQGAIIFWLNLEGLKAEDATLETVYLALNRILGGELRQLWNSRNRTLEYKLSELERLMPEASIFVLENIDPLLDTTFHFRDAGLENFFRYFARPLSRVSFIVTARSEPKSTGGETGWRSILVKGLDSEGAILLLRQDGVAGSSEQLAQIATALSGHPQSLKVVATLISQGRISIEGFLSNAQSGLDDINRLIALNVFSHLSEAEREQVRLWSVFRHPVVREALLWQREERHAIANVLESLEAQSIISRQGEGYYLLPLSIRNAACAELEEQPELHSYAHMLAAQFFLQRALGEKQRELEAINDRFEAHYHYRAAGDEKRAWTVARSMLQPLMDHSLYRQLEIIVSQTLGDGIEEFPINIFRARTLWLAGKYQDALDDLDVSYRFSMEGSFERAVIINEVGVVLKERSRPEDAEDMLKAFVLAYKLFRKVIETSDDSELQYQCISYQADTKHNRALIYQYYLRGVTPEEISEVYREARDLYQEALAIYRAPEINNEASQSQVLRQLGEIYGDSRFIDYNQAEAERMLVEAVEIASRAGFPWLEVSTSYALARFYRQQKSVVRSRALFRQAADLAASISSTSMQAMADVQIAEIDFQNNEYDFDSMDNLLSSCEEKLSYAEDAHSIRVQSDAYYRHALLRLRVGGLTKAEELFSTSIRIIEELAKVSKSSSDLRRIGRAKSGLSQIEQARLISDTSQIEDEENHKEVGEKIVETLELFERTFRDFHFNLADASMTELSDPPMIVDMKSIAQLLQYYEDSTVKLGNESEKNDLTLNLRGRLTLNKLDVGQKELKSGNDT